MGWLVLESMPGCVSFRNKLIEMRERREMAKDEVEEWSKREMEMRWSKRESEKVSEKCKCVCNVRILVARTPGSKKVASDRGLNSGGETRSSPQLKQSSIERCRCCDQPFPSTMHSAGSFTRNHFKPQL